MRDHNSLLHILIEKKKSAAHVASVRLTSMHFDSRGVGAYFLLGMAAFFLYRKRVKQEKKKFNAFTPL